MHDGVLLGLAEAVPELAILPQLLELVHQPALGAAQGNVRVLDGPADALGILDARPQTPRLLQLLPEVRGLPLRQVAIHEVENEIVHFPGDLPGKRPVRASDLRGAGSIRRHPPGGLDVLPIDILAEQVGDALGGRQRAGRDCRVCAEIIDRRHDVVRKRLERAFLHLHAASLGALEKRLRFRAHGIIAGRSLGRRRRGPAECALVGDLLDTAHCQRGGSASHRSHGTANRHVLRAIRQPALAGPEAIGGPERAARPSAGCNLLRQGRPFDRCAGNGHGTCQF